MKGKQTALWILLAVAVLCGVAWEAAPLEDATRRFKRLPENGFGIRSKELPLLPDEKEILKNANVLRREYIFKGHPLTLTVIDGTRDRHAVHDPFYCIRGSGWEIVSESPLDVPGGTAKLLHVRKDGNDAEALIWFSDSQQRYPSAKKYWSQTTLRRLTFGWSSPEPVLVNLLSVGDKAVNWSRLIQEFPGLFEI